MANYDQRTRNHCLDLSCFQAVGVDIAEGRVVKLDAATDGITITSSDVGAFGITVDTIKVGKYGRVAVYGVAVAVAGGTVTKGAPVMSDSAGKVVDQTAGKYQIGIALDGTTTSGDQVRVLLTQAKNA